MADSTVAPSGGDFTTLAAALSDSGTGSGDTITISGDWSGGYDTTAATIADTNITIVTTGDSRHNGVENATGANYRLAVTSGTCITSTSSGCEIDGLVLVLDNTGSSNEGYRSNSSSGTERVINCIIRAANNTTQQDGIYTSQDLTIELENNIIIGFGRAGIHAQAVGSAQTFNIISCTLWNNGLQNHSSSGSIVDGSQGGRTLAFNIHNTISVDPGFGDCYDDSGQGTTTWNIDNCIDSDGSITDRDSGAVNENENVTVVEGNPGSGELGFIETGTAPFDLTLFDDSSDNVAQDNHTADTGAGLTIGDFAGSAVDIVGTSRPQNTNYDIGAFEVVAAAAGDDEDPYWIAGQQQPRFDPPEVVGY